MLGFSYNRKVSYFVWTWVYLLFTKDLEVCVWRRKRQPTPVFMSGESHGPRSLVGYMGSQRVGHDWSDLAWSTALISGYTLSSAHHPPPATTQHFWVRHTCILFILQSRERGQGNIRFSPVREPRSHGDPRAHTGEERRAWIAGRQMLRAA